MKKDDWEMRLTDLLEFRDLTAGEFYQAIKQRLIAEVMTEDQIVQGQTGVYRKGFRLIDITEQS